MKRPSPAGRKIAPPGRAHGIEKPRILLFSVSSGGGHIRAAEAISSSLLRIDDQISVEHRDALSMTNPVFRKVYSKTYVGLCNHAPSVLGYIYDHMDKPSGRKTVRMRAALDKLNTWNLVKFAGMYKPDIIVSTHFLPAEIFSSLAEGGRSRIPQAMVVTDFTAHLMWCQKKVEMYFVAVPETAARLTSLGVPGEHIRITGIPVDPGFGNPKDIGVIRRDLGLREDLFTLLVSCGGFGVGPVERVVDSLTRIRAPFQLIVVIGRNERLLAKLKSRLRNGSVPYHLEGYTDRMSQLMGASDLVVSKPGGLISAEALASGLPMVIINPIPGQEERNSDLLLEEGCAAKANDMETLAWKVECILGDPDRLGRMRENSKRLGQPQASAEIARQILEFVHLRKKT